MTKTEKSEDVKISTLLFEHLKRLKVNDWLTCKGNADGKQEYGLKGDHLAGNDVEVNMIYHGHILNLYSSYIMNQRHRIWLCLTKTNAHANNV